MSRSLRPWLRLAACAATLAFLVARLGSGPFLDGLRTLDARTVAAAMALTASTTLCCAWRWRTVARGLGLELSLGAAVAAYYQSIVLNVTLPGGVLGDVRRGVGHGRDASDVGRGLRGVAWDRSAGQAVQAILTVGVLVALPSPVRPAMPLVAVGLVAALGGVVLLARTRSGGGPSRRARLLRAAAGDLRDGLLARRAWPTIAVTSALAVAGHAALGVVAARSAGTSASAARLLPLALLVLLALALPGVGAWGPREGVTAWVFAEAGLGAGHGVATGVAYGVLVLVASLPGAAILALAWARRAWPPRTLAGRVPVVVQRDGAPHA